MVDWGKYPFVRLLVSFAVGIFCFAQSAVPPLSNLALSGIVLTLFLMALLASAFCKRQRANWLFWLLLNGCLFCVGYALTQFHDATSRRTYFRAFADEADCYLARVVECPQEKEKTVKAILELDSQYGDSLPERRVTGKVMAYFKKTDAALRLRYGDWVIVPAPIPEVAPPKNPGEFDYRDFLSRKGITGQIYLDDTDWIDTKMRRVNPIYAFSYRFRDILLHSLERCGLQGEEYGVAAAILLGYDDSLPVEVRQNYVAAGAMHILCVSGMHVGIIYLLSAFLLSFLSRKKWQRDLKQVLLLALIWLYALIAGLSPSIMRASLMISFVIFGEIIHRKGFAINSIAASAFVLLCVNPNNLFELGFLLSYVAVVGIVVLQKPIYNLLHVKNKLLDKAWEITAVALAAQMATMPITLYYFHQFTVYFWLSNLFMTPVSFVVIMGGMILLMVSWIPYVNVVVGYFVWGAIYLMNWLVDWVESLPYAIVKGLYVDGFEFAMLLLVLLLVAVLLSTRRKCFLLMAMTCLLLFVGSVAWRRCRMGRQDEIMVYSLRNHTAVDFVKGGEHVLLCDSALLSDAGAVDYSLKGNWCRCGLDDRPETIGIDDSYENAFVCKRGDLISSGGVLIALWQGEKFNDTLQFRVSVDYVLVTQKQRPDVPSVLMAYKPNCLLIDGSVPVYLAERWRAQAEDSGLSSYYVGDGALRLKKQGRTE